MTRRGKRRGIRAHGHGKGHGFCFSHMLKRACTRDQPLPGEDESLCSTAAVQCMCRESGCGCRIDEDSEMKTHSTQIEDREVGGRKDVN